MNEGEQREATFPKSDGTVDTVQQVNFRVKYKEKEHSWTVTKGQTINSLFGQIALVGNVSGALTFHTPILPKAGLV